MENQKIWYHVLEHGIEVGRQGCYESEIEAQKSVDHLQKTFEDQDLYFSIWESESNDEPPIVTV